ncbi:Oidioi.mRNA.OKI2018_I69.PAR.g9155.t1.cds [Oikopleura dioica]|uniref:Oidioi.mRNA.OKI2018_I69.PAR.g9155.t1.cds n=1 Tax=Oikopleura dioica TaxID=34765 RepID=A0ABN7RKB1_OIKDI|nr:Oidioi.mRNA.OKI2018_I69.PAR.g9155.t1.cds [Oikopleura dioica]
MKNTKFLFLFLAIQRIDACFWGRNEEISEKNTNSSKIFPSKSPPRINTRPKPPSKKKKKPKKKQAPPLIDYVGDKPKWESVPQKGKVCTATSTAAVPCKDPIKVGAKCDERMNWSNNGYIQSIVHCIKNPKGGVIRKELRQECNYDSGVLKCWQHWSTTG